MSRGLLLLLIVATLPACQPRPVVVAPPPPPPAPRPPPPPPVPQPVRAERLYQEGATLLRQSRWLEAAERYRAAAELMPGESRFALALAEALLGAGQTWEAADALQLAIRIDEEGPEPNHRVLAVDYERLIRLLTQVGRLDEARVARERQEFHRRMRDQMIPP